MSFPLIAFVTKKNSSADTLRSQITKKGINNVTVFEFGEEPNKNEYDFIEYDVEPNKEKAILLDFGQCTSEFGLYNEVYEPPKSGDKAGLQRAKDNAKLDGINIFLHEEDKKIAPIRRGEVVSTLQRIRTNAMTSRDAKSLIMLFDASTDINEILYYAWRINEIKTGEPIKQSSIDWVSDKWYGFVYGGSMNSEARNIKALKTRAKNIVRDGKKLSSLYYFADWLLENERTQSW